MVAGDNWDGCISVDSLGDPSGAGEAGGMSFDRRSIPVSELQLDDAINPDKATTTSMLERLFNS